MPRYGYARVGRSDGHREAFVMLRFVLDRSGSLDGRPMPYGKLDGGYCRKVQYEQLAR